MLHNSSPALLPPRWVKWTQVGNVQMQSRQWDLALYSYCQAAEIVRKFLASDTAYYQVDYVHLYIVSCHNLSDAHIQLQSPIDAHVLLLKAHYQAMDWMSDVTLAPEIRNAAYQALRPTLRELMDFYDFTEQPDRIIAILTATQEKIARFLREINAESTR